MNIDNAKFENLEILRHPDGSLHSLGSGNSSHSYKALDHSSGQTVVLTVFGSEFSCDTPARTHLLQNAQAVATLRHRNFAQVSRIGEAEAILFYTREFVDGETLQERVRRGGPLPVQEALKVVRQVAEVLEALMRLEHVHCGIRPSNLVLTPEGDAKLVECGLPRWVTLQPNDGRRTAHCFYDPCFTSPEQLREERLEVTSDVYSLGATLWFLLAGRCPFRGTFAEVIGAHLHTTPPFHELAAFPRAITDLLAYMLAKDPEARPSSPMQLIAAIDDCMTKVSPAPSSGVATPKLLPSPSPVRRQGISEAAASPASSRWKLIEPLIGTALAATIYLFVIRPLPMADADAPAPGASRSALVAERTEFVANTAPSYE